MEIATRCAVCDSYGNSNVVYPSTVDADSFTVEVFSARRLPDRRHYQWVSCKSCGLYRSDPISDANLNELYRISTFDYSGEVHGLKNSYRKLVSKANITNYDLLVEIGGGNGFFLEEALSMGFKQVLEIEPSSNAHQNAPDSLKPFFSIEALRPGLVENNSAEIVAMFHVLDHLPDPKTSLKIVHAMLKSKGSVCLAVHNVNSISAKILRDRSPIFDVEHTFLFSKTTLKQLLEESGFQNIKIGHYKNSYSLAYLLHLMPIRKSLKLRILKSQIGELLYSIRLTVPLGNMWAVAERI